MRRAAAAAVVVAVIAFRDGGRGGKGRRWFEEEGDVDVAGDGAEREAVFEEEVACDGFVRPLDSGSLLRRRRHSCGGLHVSAWSQRYLDHNLCPKQGNS